MKQRRPDDWTVEEKVDAILGYEKLSEEQRGVFLREKGLHEAHVVRWKAELIAAMKQRPFAGGTKNPQQKRIAALEKELRRKESALAEAAALLVLKKKPTRSGGRQRTRDKPGGSRAGRAIDPGGGGCRGAAVESLRGVGDHREDLPAVGQE